MRCVPRSLLIALVAGAALASPAMAEDVYKWTDSNGVTHYADAPPDGAKYEKLNVSRGTSRPAEEPAAAPTEGAVASAAAGAAGPGASAACVQARANVETLRNNNVVSKDTDGDGTPEQISGEALQQEIVRSEKLVEAFCS